jgi:uracil DNA glycosylase superfamily protein
MEKSKLIPFLRNNLDILFIGLNPALGSSQNKHYFSVNQSFWNQLYDSGLIITNVDKSYADDFIFGSTEYNCNFGITDLITSIAESDSTKIKPKSQDSIHLKNTIIEFSPKVSIILHSKVLKIFLNFMNIKVPDSNSGYLGNLIKNCQTIFYNIAFPHGNTIASYYKVQKYKEVKEFLLNN